MTPETESTTEDPHMPATPGGQPGCHTMLNNKCVICGRVRSQGQRYPRNRADDVREGLVSTKG